MTRNLVVIGLVLALVSISICSAETSENTTITALWNGTWVGEGESMTLTQNDGTVTGVFSSTDGKISDIAGNVTEDGRSLIGTWKESGLYQLTLSDDGTFFNGTFGFGSEDSIDGMDDSWIGSRVLDAADDAVNWTGAWDSGDDMKTVLTQEGTNVTGTFENGDVIETTLEGTVSEDGKLLTGTWEEHGGINLTLSEDRTYYNGTFGYGLSDFIEGEPDNFNGTRV